MASNNLDAIFRGNNKIESRQGPYLRTISSNSNNLKSPSTRELNETLPYPILNTNLTLAEDKLGNVTETVNDKTQTHPSIAHHTHAYHSNIGHGINHHYRQQYLEQQ